MYCEMGADGVVIGMLNPDGTIGYRANGRDLSRQQEIKRKRFTVHLMSV